jgi:hypothetical protein
VCQNARSGKTRYITTVCDGYLPRYLIRHATLYLMHIARHLLIVSAAQLARPLLIYTWYLSLQRVNSISLISFSQLQPNCLLPVGDTIVSQILSLSSHPILSFKFLYVSKVLLTFHWFVSSYFFSRDVQAAHPIPCCDKFRVQG